MTRIRTSLAASLILCLGAASLEAAPGFRKPITIDSARVSGTSDLGGFPVLVSLVNDADLQANVASPGGFDIHFRAADGVTLLSHEIERYDPATGTLVAWVRVPRLRFDVDTVIYLYYGDASVACTLSNPQSVWDPSYVGVWHLAEDPSVAGPQMLDSTSYANHGTSAGAMTAGDQVAGRIGGALDFDGVDDLVNAGSASSLDDLGPLTFSAWIRPDTSGPGAPAIGSKYGASSGRWFLEIDDTGAEVDTFELNKNLTSGSVSRVGVNGLVSYGAWQHVVATWTGSELGADVHVYKDGLEVAYQATTDGTPPSPSDAVYPFVIGNRGDGATPFDGLIDEARLSRIVRSPDWIATEFANQSQPTKNALCSDTGFACVGAQELLPGAFTNVSAASGLDTPGRKDGGLAWGDFNADGCLDLLVNTDDAAQGSRLYLQDAAGSCGGTFTDVTGCLAPSLAASVRERSAIWGDLNQDGYLDFARNTSSSDIQIYLNNGPGASGCGVSWSVFGAGGAPSQVLDGSSVPFNFNSEGLGFMDYDADGDLDLMSDQDGALAIFDNAGGTLTYVATPVLPADASNNSDYSAVADIEGDGDVDILTRSAKSPDLYLNDGNLGTFSGGTFDESATNGNKGGAAFCDFDDDGDFDLFWTDAGTNQIWEQTGVGSASFAARGVPAGIAGSIDGVACGDVDNDGDVDLMVTSDGNDQLFRNDGGFNFVDVSPAGFGVNDGEATAFGDYDRDGDVDLVINQDGANELWRNETNNNNYLVVRALHDLGGGVSRDAIGATVRLLDCSLGPLSGIREVNGGRGHGSQDPAAVHMGLPTCGSPSGPNARYVVEVQFVGGAVVRKAVLPFAIGGYQEITVLDTDADDLTACTTAVELVEFEAVGADGAAILAWQTGAEIDNVGFHLYRALEEQGPFERVHAGLIAGLGSSPSGARYEYVDSGVENGTTYFYELEDVETTGRTTRHGPVAVTPGASDTEPPPSPPELVEHPEETGALPARLSFGDPEGSELRVRERGREVFVELETRGFHAVPLEDGSVRIDVPGFSNSGDAWLPVRREWLSAMGELEIVSVRVSGVQAFSSLTPASPERLEVVMEPSGTVGLRHGSTDPIDFDAGELVPREAARVLESAFHAGQPKTLLELAPIRFDPEHRRLLLARTLRVRLRWRATARTDVGVRGPVSDLAFDLVTEARGLHAVAFEKVFPGSRRPVPTKRLRLSRLGEPVAYHVEPEDGRFAPGSVLYFVGAGGSANPYGDEAVYRLQVGVEGLRMPTLFRSPEGALVEYYRERVAREEDRLYQAALVDVDDPWLWESLLGGSRMRVLLEATAVTQALEPARLSVSLRGGTDYPVSPDHHVRLWWNGTLVGEDSWNAKRARTVEVELPRGALVDGHNYLEIENVGDTEATYSIVLVDRIELDYPRMPVPSDGLLEGESARSGRLRVPGLPAESVVLDVTEATPLWLTSPREAESGGLELGVEKGRRYLAVSPERLRSPDVRSISPSALVRGTNQADYIAIGPGELLDAATALLRHRESQGLTVAAVSLDEVYSQFGHGEARPDAIRSFLRHAYFEWRSPAPRYVLLLGDGTYDFEDLLGLGRDRQKLPPLMIPTRFIWTASDPSYAAVDGEDLLPDVAIGRLPAKSASELRTLVDKILAYEWRGTVLGSGRAILVADDPDPAGDFESDTAALENGLFAGRDVEGIYLRRLGVSETRARIVEAFDSGASIVSYLGHGGIDLWAGERIFTSSDVSRLSPQSAQPLVLSMNCLNGYFHFPFFDALGETLLQAEDRGAIAVFAPSGLSLHRPAFRFQEALLRELLSGRHPRLGDAILAGQRAFADTGALPELVAIYHLFGDPALVIDPR